MRTSVMMRSSASDCHMPLQLQCVPPRRFAWQCCSSGVNVPTSPSCCARQLFIVEEIPDPTMTTARHASETYTTTSIEMATAIRDFPEPMARNLPHPLRAASLVSPGRDVGDTP